MKKIRMRHIITLLTIIGLVSFGSTAMAYRGWKGDCEQGSEDGQGRRGGGRGGYAAELTEEQRTQLDELRKAFREDTQELRDRLRDKADALHAELEKDSVDTVVAESLQKDLSEIKAELDLKRLAHRIAMHNLFPELEDGRRFKGGRGHGPRGGCD